MPTALELLETEICDDILVVDLESRSIIIPKNVSVLGVEADDETRILHFKVPRRYCEVDLAEFAIRVNYKNAKSEGDMYIVTDAVIEDDWITFDWVVGRHAFTKKGNVVFNVCLKDVFEGIVRREFNTTVAILPVLEGLETGEEIAEEHLDIFEQLREELASDAYEIAGEAVGSYINEHIDDIKGPKGDAFKYEDFTPEQLESLKGPKGDTFTYDDLTEEQIQSLKGPHGDAFEYEDFTEEQLAKLVGPSGSSIKSITRTSGNGAPGTTDTYTVTLTDGSTTTFQVYNGANGEGAGDMTSQVYDPQGKATDIFAYVDEMAKTAGKVKTVNGQEPDENGNIEVNVEDEIFIAEYGVTAIADIVAAHNAGKAVFCKKENFLYTLAVSGSMVCSFVRFQGSYIEVASVNRMAGWSISEVPVDSSGIPNLGENITEGYTNDTVAFWAAKGSGQAWFSANEMLVNQPAQYGFVISYVNGADVFQMFSDQTNGVTYFRYGDNVNNWFKHWAKVYDDTCDIGGVFIVTPYVTTFAEAMAAYEEGKSLYCEYDNKVGVLYRASESEMCWVTTYYQYVIRYDVTPDDSWTVYNVPYEADLGGSTFHEVTIGTTWTENEDTGVKSQTIQITGVTASKNAHVEPRYTGDGTSEGYAAFVEQKNQFFTYITNGYAETVADGITFYIFGDAPTVDIPVLVEVK